MNKKESNVKSIVIYAVSLFLVVALVVGNILAFSYASIISLYLGHETYKLEDSGGTGDSTYFDRVFSSEEERLIAEAELCELIEAEGIVLLKNDNDVLPVATSSGSTKVSVFGVGGRDFVYGGTGSGSVDTSTAPTLIDALLESGYSVNETLQEFYTNGRGKNYISTTANISGGGEYVINECPESAFTNPVKNSFTNYNDMALVVFNRAGSESSDLPKVSKQDPTRSYLELTAEEESLLSMVAREEYGFKRIVVIINSATPMELGFLNKAEYNIDACLWVGNVGQSGMYAIGEVLCGNVNPSGALVDTYAYDTLGAPAIQNQGAYSFTNATNSKGNSYMVYAEGIYVGYRYYETRYEDTILGSGNAGCMAGVTRNGASGWNYADEVQFPFGYGLSYTEFVWSSYSVTEKDHAYEVSVTVKNVGSAAGKDIVQVYMQSPYTQYDIEKGIEKASIELVGYSKTKLLEPDEEETLTISVPKELLKVYDAKGHGTYIVEGGNYYFTVATDAHDAVNNILAAKGKTVADGMDYDGNTAMVTGMAVEEDLETYAFSQETGNPISNQFADVDIQTYDPNFSYLSRNDWEGTYPVTYQNGKWEAPETILNSIEISYQDRDDSIEFPVQNADNGLTLAMLMNEDINSEIWDDLLDQMSYDELVRLVKDGGYMIQAIQSISAPGALNLDGPAGIISAAGIIITLDEQPFSWVCEVVLASTWNDKLAKQMGEMVGEDALANSQGDQKVNGWYAPAMNIHRTAYSGRNFEYYSEDSFLSGAMAAAEIKGATSKGLICYIKHFAVNDQETNRTGGVMLANEQSVRQLYLYPFEVAIREGGSMGLMVSMNRIGSEWVGAHKGMMTETLRKEWGFEGIALTDQASYSSFSYMDIREGLAAGTTMWLNTDKNLWLEQLGDYANNPLLLTQLRTAAKYILYTVSRSSAMNGLNATAKIVPVMPTWQIWLITLDVIVGLAIAAILICDVRNKLHKKKRV